VNTTAQTAREWNTRSRPSRTPVAVGTCALCDRPLTGDQKVDGATHGHCLDVIRRMDRDLAARRALSGDVTRPVPWMSVQW
jgi:hypothetical protein